jgi:recombinational DNA repair ATPase RecF
MIEALLQICRERGLRCEDLDEVVHDAAEKAATSQLNRMAETSQQEAILSDYGSRASRINNSGLRTQVEFLIGICGEEEARKILLEVDKA